ncbi:hypothetical protein Patl1_09790 [Pistacia atlantica]|uniref:Uncharacterized protein n=1 Tax=Pistacia atlantica TaxID=434234 RepID=A0ACC1AA19_9ROSI|nr:hypothetical protein Patl1_09790 [Pistacia atlantica]
MSLLSFPSTINHCNKTISNSLPFTSQTSHNFHRFSVHSTKDLSLVSFDAKSDSGATDHEDHRALETVLKLYSAIKSQNIQWRKNHVPLGKGFSFYVCQIYQGQGGDKERGDVHGTTPSYGAFQTQNNELRHDGSGQAELLYNDKGSETKGFIIQIIVPSILLGCTSVIFKAWIVLSHKGIMSYVMVVVDKLSFITQIIVPSILLLFSKPGLY